MSLNINRLLHNHFLEVCPEIHVTRLESVIAVAYGLQKSQSLSLTAMGRALNNESRIKNKIKKVDRLENNKHLHAELEDLYCGLSSYIFKYITHETIPPIIIDLCYLKDTKNVQMLSAEIAMKGRSLPLYREVFKSGEFSGRAKEFLLNLSRCVPEDKRVIIIMDAGFGEDWFKEIELQGWHWLTRIRQGKQLKLQVNSEWKTVKEVISEIDKKTKSYNEAFIMKEHNRSCRIVTTYKSPLTIRKKSSKKSRNDKAGSDQYRRSAREPWILATNLSAKEYNATKVIVFYSKRMQIEESFRDLKSHQFGLSARYIRTQSVYRWAVKMCLAAIVQVMFWIIGVIGHSQNFQTIFQANTVKDKKVFSYFYLGQLIVQYDKLDKIQIDYEKLMSTIELELKKQW